MELVCANKCYFRGRVYMPGEKASFSEGETVPRHFQQKGKPAPVVPVGIKEPRAYSELNGSNKKKKSVEDIKTMKDLAEESPEFLD